MNSIIFILLLAITANGNHHNLSSIIRIYSNLAEIIQPLNKLPLEFNDEDWNQIRSDSITLIGENLNITSQTITEKKKSLNGTEIYIRSPLSSDKTSTIKLIKGLLVDENDHLVKIQDESIAGQQSLYINVPNDQIYYIEQPTKATYAVNFTYSTLDSKIFVSYLQSNINWQTQYQLNSFDNHKSELIAMANIRNDGKSSITIDHAELIGGDINLQSQHQFQYDRAFRSSHLNYQYAAQPMADSSGTLSSDSDDVSVQQGKELAGLYIFPINKRLTINAKTNYLLPMFQPKISLERYGLISKIFSPISTTGKAQRTYCLKSNRYLSQGNCIIRENDRVVGETLIPNLAGKDKYEFSIGEDADIIYKENITLVLSKTYNETEPIAKVSYDKDQSSVVIVTRTRSVYNIDVQLKNFKLRPVNIQYEQKGLYTYQTVELSKPTKYEFIRDGSTIKSNITLKANTTENFSFTLTLVR